MCPKKGSGNTNGFENDCNKKATYLSDPFVYQVDCGDVNIVLNIYCRNSAACNTTSSFIRMVLTIIIRQ